MALIAGKICMKNINATKFLQKTPGAIALMVFCIFIFTLCTKEPTASFESDKTEYVAGETVHLTNTSVNADSYQWTFPGGQNSNTTDLEYTFPETTASGDYEFKLEASNEGKKKANVSKSVKVIAATGRVTAWTFNQSVGLIQVKIDDELVGSISGYYFFNPGCEAKGCVSATLNVGTHTVTAVYASTSSSGTVSIKKNQCTMYKLE